MANNSDPLDDSFFDDNGNFIDNDGETYFDTAIGIGLGKKWVNKKGFVLDIMLGVGRNLGFSDQSEDFVFKGDIAIGYRF